MDLKKIFKDTQDFQNIQEIETPPEMEKRYKSGIDFIDQLFGEGMTPGTITLFTGSPGAGKSTLCLQIADGLASQDITVAFNSSEEHITQVKKTVDRLGLQHPFYVSNNSNIEGILRQVRENDVKVLFIDSLQTTGTSKYDPGTLKATKVVSQKVIQFCKENFLVGIIIGQVNKNGTAAGPNLVSHMVDIHCHLDLCSNPSCVECEVGSRKINFLKNRYGPSNSPKSLYLFPNGFKAI